MSQPKSQNFLASHRFRISISRIPNVIYYCQEVTLPGTSMGSTIQPTPFIDLNVYGNKLTYDDLNITFSVDEDMYDYSEIHDWMAGIAYPASFSQRQAAQTSRHTDREMYSDLSLVIINSDQNANKNITFTDTFPVSLSSINFNSKATDVETIPATVTFKFALMKFSTLSIES